VYYLKAALIIARRPAAVLFHPHAGDILRSVTHRRFRLHWLRDIANGY
jgi:hypothetical protein